MAGVSYAVWQMTLTQEDDNLITSSCFQVTMTEKNPISLQNAIPMTEQDAESLVPYTFTIHNECGENALYEIHYEILNNTTFTEKEEQEFIKIKFQEEKPKFLNSLDKTDKTLNNASRAYVIERGYIKANETKNYELKVWLDENVTVDDGVMGKIFASEVTITARYDREILTSPEVELVLSRCSDDIIASVKTSGNVIDTYEYTIDSEDAITENEATHTFTDQGRGTRHHVKVKVTDVYGNITEKEGDIEIPEYPTLLGKQIGKDIEVVTEGEGLYEVTHCEGTIENDELTDVQKEGFLLEEYRYAGKNPNNYITFNDEEWRIIGLVNVLVSQADGSEKVEQRVKIVKNESIGQYSWDTSPSDVNSGWGVNEWSQADLMKLLNPGYENNQDKDSNGSDIKVNNSLYWTGESGNCYSSSRNQKKSCDFANGLNDVDSYIANDIIWNTGANQNNEKYTQLKASDFYLEERSNGIGKNCQPNDTYVNDSGTSYHLCTDSVERKTTWEGKVALLYPSDYGYASGDRSCLDSYLYNWSSNDCYQQNWLFQEKDIWTLTTGTSIYSAASYIFFIRYLGHVPMHSAETGYYVFPTLYLKPEIKIVNGEGKADGSYELSEN